MQESLPEITTYLKSEGFSILKMTCSVKHTALLANQCSLVLTLVGPFPLPS